jgi:alpha-beta hydrolase superfamily lysophospholipase
MFPPVKSFIGMAIKPFLPRYFQPFKEFDLSDPKMQSGIKNFLPHADLDDPEVQDDIRHTIVTVSLLDQLRKLGKKAYHKAKRIDLPSLVIQGKNDELVKPQFTLRLKERLANGRNDGAVKYVEVDAEHDILSGSNPSWATVERSILTFADHLKNSSG